LVSFIFFSLVFPWRYARVVKSSSHGLRLMPLITGVAAASLAALSASSLPWMPLWPGTQWYSTEYPLCNSIFSLFAILLTSNWPGPWPLSWICYSADDESE
jgi:hypothetical protein